MKIVKRLFAYLLVFSLLASTPIVLASASTETKIVSQQLSLGDDLTMKFYVSVENQYQSSAVIKVALGNKAPQSYPVADMTADANGYCVSVDLAAPQMNDNIAVSVTSGDTVLTSGNYSIAKYCRYLIDGNYTEATKQMAKQVLNYGAAAQVYFDYNAENLANAGYEPETVAEVPTEGYEMTLDGQVDGITPYGASLLLNSKITVRYYFFTADASAYTFTVDGKNYEVKNKDGLYYIDVPGINPQSYADAVNLTVSDGTASMTVGYSPMTYMVRMCAKDTTSANLKFLLNAMYGYYLKARTFVDIREDDARALLPVYIVDNAVCGIWDDDKKDSESIGPQNSYDGNMTTNWNPKVKDFASGEGIVYTLDNTYDLTQIVLTTHRMYYFDLLGSADGVNFEKIFTMSSSNAADYYIGEVGSYVCDLNDLNAEGVKYLQIIFTGCVNIDATHVSLYEIEITGKKPYAVEDGRAEYDTAIIRYALDGTWVDDRENISANASKTYDGDTTTNWNPKTSNFKSGEAIIYTLDNLTELTTVELTFGTRLHYFDLRVSADGTNFTHIARVNASTASKYFNGLVATIDGINTVAKYIRLDFLGTENNSSVWINMMEITAKGKIPEAMVDDGREPVNYKIIANTVEGTWVKNHVGSPSAGPELSYDGSVSSYWNPQATNYISGEAIVYTLDKAYDLDAVSVTVVKREYYFDLSVSADGENYTHIARVDQNSMSRYYNGLVATINGIGASNVKYVRLKFLGANTADNTRFIALAEVSLTCKKHVVDNTNVVAATVTSHEVVGTWENSYAESATLGPQKSYDGDTTSSYWQGLTTNYKSGEGIVYTLDDVYELREVNLFFRNRPYYFDLYVSSDGSAFTKLTSVTAENEAEYFTDYVCTISDLEAAGVKYIKIVFTGNQGTLNFWVGLFEIQVSGKKAEVAEEESFAVSGVFTSNMVLQRNHSIPVWGWADAGDTVTGTFAGATATATADADGYWKLNFPAQSANAEAQTMTITCSTGSKVNFTNILIGDVYIINGQSNAELAVNRTASHLDNNGKEVVKESFRQDSKIRLFHQIKAGVVERSDLWAQPQADVINDDWQWAVASDNDAFWTFSALGMYFAKTVRETLSEDIPIGLIQTAAGGAYLDELMPNELNQQFGYTSTHTVSAGGYYNTMIHPFVGYPIAGMLYFQGESNSYNMTETYARDLTAYITTLRNRWGQNFNFYNVQLSSYGQYQVDNNIWPYLPQVRNEQYQVLNMLDNYYLTVAMDVGYSGEVDAGTNYRDYMHPKNKKALGERIAKQAFAVYYNTMEVGEQSFSPVPSDIQWNSDGIIISFKNADTLALAAGDNLVGFQCVINEDVVDVAAQIVNGNQVKLPVDATTVSEIRYAMFSLGYVENANLVNGSGLPAPAFAIANPGPFTTNKVVVKKSETSLTGWKSLGVSAAAPYHSYDRNAQTYWNPQVSSFAAEPSVTYYLNVAADLEGLTFSFMNRKEYFTLYTSKDGSTFTEAAKITADNYTDSFCTVDGLDLTGVTAIKLVFTGSSDGSLWIGLYEVGFLGQPTA